MVRARGWRTIGGTVGYAVSCVLAVMVLAVAGYAHYVQRQVGGLASSNVDMGGPQTGAMNILLMGLESRTDYDGNVLPAGLLAAMHAGSVNGVLHEGVGGQDTNTLILIHIFAGGQKAVGFSIPRDDLVTFPQPYDGESEGKIDQAYGLAWAQSLNQTVNSSMSHDRRYFLANEAGQAAAIATVSAVTGEHIDHFAEVNLAGFYALAQAFHGIGACVKPWDGGRNLHDLNSGFNQRHAGYLHLTAAQALAFVRERDNLPNGDLDRTHRQQAVLDYVLWDLGHQGALTDLGQLTNLLDVARRYMIASGGWNLLEFASEMHALTGKNLALSTLPIATTQNNVMVNGVPQDVNIVNLPYARHLVQSAFSQPAASQVKGPAARKKPASIPPLSTVTVDVYNGGTTDMLAAAVSQALVSAGYQAGATGSPAAQSQAVRSSTQVFYGAGAAANAAKIAGYFGAAATKARSVAAGHVEVLLGTTSTSVPAGLGASSSGSPTS
ncbi:MAG TPA: LCP family protein, partial [Streptosporangiaceae bacterium]|nr:LCP family protein [Streptosporangiaceae bacterium]